MNPMTPPPQEEDEILSPQTDISDGPQSMEVALAEGTSTLDTQPVKDPRSTRFTWKIENFSSLNTKKLYSDVFLVGGKKWRMIIFPEGNNVDQLSIYLDVADSATLPHQWSRFVQFSLTVVNQIHKNRSIRKDTHLFDPRESDWGFTSFMSLGEFYDPTRGFLLNDTCIVEANVIDPRGVDYWLYDSKKETGYVGITYQGATFYMNSLLQTLYHIPYFRKAVYHIPTTEDDIPSISTKRALQSLFYRLQYSDTSVAAEELTESVQWPHIFHSILFSDTWSITKELPESLRCYIYTTLSCNVEYLYSYLCSKLGEDMKGSVFEGTIQQLFEGHHMKYIECVDVDYKSTRKESFCDLQLDVKGCKDIYASLDKYVEVKRLEGDKKYHAEEYGLQDARKGVLFIDFPPVLQLQLERFNFVRDTMVKINDRYGFPLQLDLDRENGKYLSSEADKSVRNLYTLHSVLVHSGGVFDGHYRAYIRPTLSDQWFGFDDDRVMKSDMKMAMEEQFGGDEDLHPGSNNSNACMLVYIREIDKNKIISNVDEKDIAERLRIWLRKEQEEKELKTKEKSDARLYIIIKVARDVDLTEQIGRDVYFDLVDHDKARSFRIQKETPFNLFKEEVAKAFDIPVQCQRFWLWAKCQNNTYRPERPLNPQEEAQSVGQLGGVSEKSKYAELKLFLEDNLGKDSQPMPLPVKTEKDILLFFKIYDPLKEELRYGGRIIVKVYEKTVDILKKINKLAGFPPDEKIKLYKEIRFEPGVVCEPVIEVSCLWSQSQDGDIICLQKSSKGRKQQYRYPDVPSFLKYVQNRQVIRFRSLEKPEEDDFFLELSKLHTYDDVVERVAQHLSLDDQSKIRLTSHNSYSQQPKQQPIKYRGVDRLPDMLLHYKQTSDILYYEVLDIPLPELEGLKTLKVAFHRATKDEVVVHAITLPTRSSVGDVLNDLKSKVQLSHPSADLRLVQVFNCQIYKIFPLNEKIESINDQYWTLRAEEIPEEEKNLGRHEWLIRVYHFKKEPALNQVIHNIEEPFLLVIHEGETLIEVKMRIQKRLQVPDEDFEKWKFAFLSFGQHEYLQNSDIVSTRFQRRAAYGYGAWVQHLGLEHPNNTLNGWCTTNQTTDIVCHEVSHHEGLVDNDTRLMDVDVTESHDSDKEMDTFFENLEPELLRSKTPSEDVKEALSLIEEALNMAKANPDCPERISKVKSAFTALSALGYNSTLTVKQKGEIRAMEKKLEDLTARAVKAVKEKSIFTQKESLKSTIGKNLGGYLVEYKEANTEIEEAKRKISALQEQIETLNGEIGEARKKKQKVFHLSKDAKAELEELKKNWPEYEAKFKSAEDEEKEIAAEWGKMKEFILSIS